MTAFDPARHTTAGRIRRSSRWVTLLVAAALAIGCGDSAPAESKADAFVVPTPATAPDDAIAAFLGKGGLPALMVGVIDDGQTLYTTVAGVRKRGDATRVTRADTFHIGSNTKAMTALVAGTVVDAGQLTWTATVGDVLSGTIEVGEAYRTVTLAQLLNHSSGIPAALEAGDESSFYGSTEPVANERRRMAALALARPPEAAPGKFFRYSNLNYVIAGLMLEVVTGQSWETLIAERLFAAVGMTHAGFGPPAAPGMVDAPWGHDPLPIDPGSALADGPEAYGPAGTVHANLSDLLTYVWLYFNGGLGYMGQTALNEIETPRLHHYGFGWFVSRDENGELVLWHNGSNRTFYSTLVLFPERRGAIILATNDGSDVAWTRIAQLDGYLAAHFGLPLERPPT